MSPVTVQPVASRRDLREFLELPYRLHSSSGVWVPPLRLERRDILRMCTPCLGPSCSASSKTTGMIFSRSEMSSSHMKRSIALLSPASSQRCW